jgi:hypothetical protein
MLAAGLFQASSWKKLSVAQVIDGHRWTRNLNRDLSSHVLVEAILLLEKLQGVSTRSPGHARFSYLEMDY